MTVLLEYIDMLPEKVGWVHSHAVAISLPDLGHIGTKYKQGPMFVNKG